MPYTQADLDRLKRAYARGVRSVRFGDHQLTFDSAADHRQKIADVERELAAADSRVRVRQIRVNAKKGWRR